MARHWSLAINVSAGTSHDKENASLLNFVSQAVHQQTQLRTGFDLLYDYEMKEQAANTHPYKLSPGVDYYLSQRLFRRLTGGYHYNYLAADYNNINLRPGYAVFQDKPLQLV